ncbi:ABC transporter substrate-binding protein [Primorskyibacter sp. S87]|uniref:ABC transporter substrate-binding protein n=1 Tax=Primorskyibacter sp. S87 TaxID=3415126 RepID=UPI003C7E1F19
MSRLDRRALFTSGAAAALLAATGVSLNAAPKTGGTLRLAVPREGDMLAILARGAVFDTLTEIAPDGTLRGELATGWQTDAEARLWQFELRDGVQFHDGTNLTAEDVLSTLRASGISLRHADITGPFALLLELEESRPDLPLVLAQDSFGICPRDKLDMPFSEIVGAGCYQVERAREGRHFRARRVAEHYRADRAGWANVVEIAVIPDPSVRAEALRDGFVDVAVLPEPEGLIGRGKYRYHPSERDMTLAVASSVGLPGRIGGAALDGGRLAERWWML